MPTTLKEHQFEILPDAEADSGIAFGAGLNLSVDEAGFKPGGIEWFTEDQDNPNSGVKAFGQDMPLASTWAWDIFVNEYDKYDAIATLNRIESMWRAHRIREEVGAVTAVRYRLAGRDRRIFGRPRRFEKTIDNMLLSGYAPVATDFQCVDAYTYDDAESFHQLVLDVDGDGGFTFPLTFPYATQQSGLGDSRIQVFGDVKTYPVIRFVGPIVNPSLETREWSLRLNIALGEQETIVVDTRPWVNSVMFNGDTPMAGVLGPRQWLSRLSFEPGEQELVFRGEATAGGALCEITWRSAWDSI